MAVVWTAILAAVLVALLIILIKFLIWNCLLANRDDDSRPILQGRRGEHFWMEYERRRLQGLRSRQPPPDFDEALRTSRPISYIDLEEEPPPTYEDFLKSRSPSPQDSSPSHSLPQSIQSIQGVNNSSSSERTKETDTSEIGEFEFDDNFVDIDLSAHTQAEPDGFTIRMADLHNS